MRAIPSLIYSCFLGFALSFTGCHAHLDKRIIPLNDEILIFPRAYDLVYLRTLEAVESVDGWELEETEKEKGIIRIRNINFSRFDDSDRRTITFLIERYGRKETSVRLAPQSQRTTGGDMFLKRISELMSRDI